MPHWTPCLAGIGNCWGCTTILVLVCWALCTKLAVQQVWQYGLHGCSSWLSFVTLVLLRRIAIQVGRNGRQCAVEHGKCAAIMQ
jgi:hypothetical protein